MDVRIAGPDRADGDRVDAARVDPARVDPAQHRADVTALVAPALGTRTVPVAEAAGRIAAADVVSLIAQPPFANSQMDGFAVALDDLLAARADDGTASLQLGPTIAAGDAPSRLEPGTARPIMTGAPIPDGADYVQPVERTTAGAFVPGATRIELTGCGDVTAGDLGTFVRAAGSDTAAGAVVVHAGDRLTPGRIGVLAAGGRTEIEVLEQPRTLVLSTGSELTAPGEELAPGRIYDANGAAIAAALAELGVPVIGQQFVPDDPEAIARVLAEHADRCDLLVTSGGVSQGAFEVVKQAGRDGDLAFRSVAMQPGGPQGLGHARLARRAAGFGAATETARRIPWVALPGNPVSSLISVEMFLRPALLGLGADTAPRPHLRLRLRDDEPEQTSPPELHQVRRGRLRQDGTVELVGGPGSHLLRAYAASDCLVHLPRGVASVRGGDLVEVWILT